MHPDHRGEETLSLITNGNFGSISHQGRAFVALAVFYRYAGLSEQNEPPETVVRLNPRRPGAVEGTPDAEIPGAFRVERVDEVALREGRIWPQSRGSQLAGLCVGSGEGERVLDLCAAPGGKATQLAGEVTAIEKHPGRARELEETCARLGATNVRVLNADALELPPDVRDFDRVLVDAPISSVRCSGWRSSGCAPAGRFSTRSARSPPRRTKRSSTSPASRSSRSAGSGRSSRTHAGPSSC